MHFVYRFKAEICKKQLGDLACLAGLGTQMGLTRLNIFANLQAKGYRVLHNVGASKTLIITLYLASSAKSHFSFLALQAEPHKRRSTPRGSQLYAEGEQKKKDLKEYML